MGKPWGMDAAFRIIEPNRIQNAIYDAVTDAIENDASLDAFLHEVRECWHIALDERHRAALAAMRGQ